MATRIAVVGAGIAGLAAARRLAAEGREVVVFDKARGVGGRISTRRTEGFAFDHGAQYFTCRDPHFAEVVSGWLARGAAARWEAPVHTLAEGASRPAREDGARLVGVPGMSALARDLAIELPLVRNTRIEAIARDGDGWRLTPDAGPFDAVVVATPAPQAVPLLAPLPALAGRVAEVEMQPCHALLVAFARPLGLAFGGAFVKRSPLAWVSRNASKPGRPDSECWVAHTTPEWSAAHLEAAPEEVAAQLLEAFAAALARALPATLYVVSHRWLYARTEHPLGEPWLWDADAALGVCGDWTHGGRVENAFLSGAGLAAAMLGASTGPPSRLSSRSNSTGSSRRK